MVVVYGSERSPNNDIDVELDPGDEKWYFNRCIKTGLNGIRNLYISKNGYWKGVCGRVLLPADLQGYDLK